MRRDNLSHSRTVSSYGRKSYGLRCKASLQKIRRTDMGTGCNEGEFPAVYYRAASYPVWPC